ncbi:MAG: hypothetical protein EB068_06320 [Betaproteobacteria bacterium]|nr:hypothetical protein [Betaproteobacteria bacterium]
MDYRIGAFLIDLPIKNGIMVEKEGIMRIFRKIILFFPSLTMFFLAYFSFICDNEATKFSFRWK